MVTNIKILEGAEAVLINGGDKAKKALLTLVGEILARPSFHDWTIGTGRDNDQLTIRRHESGERYSVICGFAQKVGDTETFLHAQSLKGRIKK